MKDSSKKNKIFKAMAVFLPVLFFVFLFFEPASAQVADAIDNTVGKAVAAVVGFIAYIFVNIFGLILTLLIYILVNVAQYGKFVNVQVVAVGWVLVRDLCNMFFVLVFLVIAFSTILRMEQYNAKKMLPKLLIMAVLINFSRTIFGFIIDFSQIIMNQFVDAFKNNGAANFIEMFQVRKILTIKQFGGKEENVTNFSTAAAIIAGLIAIIITVIVVGVLLLTLIIRIVMLWIYTILSPFVFLGFAFPPIAKYTGRIWEDFIKYVIVGPILAFFIYLALFTVTQSSEDLKLELSKDIDKSKSMVATSEEMCAGINSFFCSQNFQTYIITISLLIGGLMVAQQIGGAAGSLAGKGLAAAKATGMKYTGARWASERWGAFQGRREQMRKEKAGMTGARMFAAYEGVVQAPKAAFQGVRSLTEGRLREGLKATSFGKMYGEYKGERDDKAKARVHLYDAYDNLKDKAVGEKFEKEGYTYFKNAAGGMDVKNTQGKDVISTTKAGMEYRQAYRQAYSPAKQVMDEVTTARVQKQTKNFDNLSSGELKRILESSMSSKDQRIASAMMLARKGAFNNAEQLHAGKDNLLGLPSLLKDFNEAVNRRHGLMNYSKKTVDSATGKVKYEVDESAFKNAVADGTVNISNLDTSQLTRDDKSIDLIAKISGSKFKDTLENIAKTDRDRDNIKDALGANIGNRGFDKMDLQVRNAYANHSGDWDKAFEMKTGGINRVARREAIKNMKSKDLARVDIGLFANPDFQLDFAHSMNLSKLKSLEISGESPEKLRKYIEGIRAQTGKGYAQIDALAKEINEDKSLNSIK